MISPFDTRANIKRDKLFQLWSACVAKFLYPALARSPCLAVGPAMLSYENRLLGQFPGKLYDEDDSGDEHGYHKNRLGNGQYHDNILDFPQFIEVMVVELELEVDLLPFIEDGRTANEKLFKRRWGKGYAVAKAALNEALESWRDDKEELNRRAYGYFMFSDRWEQIAALCSKDYLMYYTGYGKRFWPHYCP
jgi:hypothetical protein